MPRVALLLVACFAALCTAGRGGVRVPAEVRPCHATTDGRDVHVLRCLGGNEGGVRSALDPFLVFDSYRVASAAQLGGGFPAHAHRGFLELRYVLSGALSHRDSCGSTGRTLPGGVQMFFAGRGAAHEENVTSSAVLAEQGEAPASRFLFEGFQLWLNVPAPRKNGAPWHRVVTAAEFPVHAVPDSKGFMAPPAYHPPPVAMVKVLAGTYGGQTGPLTPFLPEGTLLLDLRQMRPTARELVSISVPTEDQHVLLYVYEGSVHVGTDSTDDGSGVIDEGEFAPLAPGLTVQLRAVQNADGDMRNAACFIATAPRLRESVFVGSGFAMHSREALDEANEDLREGRAADCAGA
jgi:redox-sensitive bicupin YhaK (pirin superfamily)